MLHAFGRSEREKTQLHHCNLMQQKGVTTEVALDKLSLFSYKLHSYSFSSSNMHLVSLIQQTLGWILRL